MGRNLTDLEEMTSVDFADKWLTEHSILFISTVFPTFQEERAHSLIQMMVEGAGTCKHCKQSKQCKSSRQSEAQALTSRLSLGLKCKLSLTFECSVIDIEIIKIKLQSLTATSFNSNSVTDIIMIRVLLSGWKKDLRRQFVFWWSSGQWQRCISVLCLSTECLLSEAAAVIVCEQGGGTRDLVANNSEHCPALGIAVVDLLTLDCFELECSKSTGHIPPIC